MEERELSGKLKKGQIIAVSMTIVGVMGIIYVGLVIRFLPMADKYSMSSSLIFLIIMALLVILSICYGRGSYDDKLIRNHMYLGLIFGAYTSSFLYGIDILLSSVARYAGAVVLLDALATYVFFFAMAQYCAYEQTYLDLSPARNRMLTRVRIILMCAYTIIMIAGLYSNTSQGISSPSADKNVFRTLIAMLLNAVYIVLTLRRVKNNSVRATLLCYNTACMIAVPVENLLAMAGHRDHYIWIYNFATFVSLFLIFCNVYVEHSRKLLKQSSELNVSKVNAMIMQINPHFIYNTLASIDSLIRTHPEEAHQLILKFSAYLRDNYSSLTNQSMVSFREELKSLEHYLAIEQVRFPNMKVVYRIQTVNFKLPGLTVQPLAENAVKHGIRKRRKGEGTLTIESEERPDDYVVRIIDDGVGFESIPNDGRNHIGISNARRRLELLCGGTLNITSIPHIGTVCEVVIPKNITPEEEEIYYEGTLRG